MHSEDRARGDWAYTITVAVVALLPRLFVAIAWAREPVWDGHYYHFGAQRIADGLGYSEDVLVDGIAVWKPWCHYPVGYSGILAGAYKAFGDALVVAPVLNAVVGAALVLAVHRLARFQLSENRARIAAAIVALHPGLIAYSAVVMTEVIAAALLLVALWIAIQLRGRWVGVVVAGLVIGVATLVRPSSILVAPLLALAMPRPRRMAPVWGIAATAAALLVVAPWSLRNCRIMDGCAFVSSNGGWNLAIGALGKTGRFHTLSAADGCRIVTGQIQQDRCWAGVGIDAIQKNPSAWLALVPKKLSQTYDHESFPIEYLREADPAAWPEARRVAGRMLLTGYHWLLLVGASLSVVGLASGRKGRRASWVVQSTLLVGILGYVAYALVDDFHPFWVLAAAMPLVAAARLPGSPRQGAVGRVLLGFIAVTTITHAVFFGDDRYHMVVAPAFAILAAGAMRPPRNETVP